MRRKGDGNWISPALSLCDRNRDLGNGIRTKEMIRSCYDIKTNKWGM